MDLEIEQRRWFYAFTKASQYANIAIRLQILANQKAAVLWDTIDAGGVVDIAGHPFAIREENIEVLDAIGVFDPFRLRLAAQVYKESAEQAGALRTGKQERHPAIPENPTNIEMIDSFLSIASAAANVLEVKNALDDLDTHFSSDILHSIDRNLGEIYDGAASDLQQHGFCEKIQHPPPKPVDPNPGENVVKNPPLPNHPPQVSHQIDPQNFTVGNNPKWRNLSSYFSDPDGDMLIYRANSSNDHIVVATIEDNSVKITPGEAGTATVTVTAEDPGGLIEEQSFRVTVQARLQTIPSLPVCDRTPQVREEIMKKTRDNNCANVTEDELESIKRLSMLEEDIDTLKQGDFDELRGLEELVLKGNFLETLPKDVFWDLGNLKELSLRNNQFTILVEDTFEHLDSLTYLSLRGNRLTTLQQGAFEDLDMLIELNLSDNQLTTLPAGVFEELFNLKELTLENNRITILSRDIFFGLSSLEDLELDGNSLHTIEAGAFNGLSSLTDLDFNNYPLHTIEAGAFNGLSSLTDLELSNTQLRTLQRDVFSGLSSLEVLDLDGTPLETIEVGAFNGLSNLSSLDLSDNQLATLPMGLFSGLSSLMYLNLRSNPGAPFILTLELARTDNTNSEAAGPASIKVKLAEGAPFDMSIHLTIEGGTLSADLATLTRGQTESDPITVRQKGTRVATVRLEIAPTIPEGYRGIQMAVGASLALFSDALPEEPALIGDVNRDGTVNILDLVFVASKFGETDAADADLNGDGQVNIQDLVIVANSF